MARDKELEEEFITKLDKLFEEYKEYFPERFYWFSSIDGHAVFSMKMKPSEGKKTLKLLHDGIIDTEPTSVNGVVNKGREEIMPELIEEPEEMTHDALTAELRAVFNKYEKKFTHRFFWFTTEDGYSSFVNTLDPRDLERVMAQTLKSVKNSKPHNSWENENNNDDFRKN